MSKFKIGDRVIPVSSNVNMGEKKYWKIKDFREGLYRVANSYCWKEEELKLYEEKGETMSKTFKEVIADIKEGEVWESCGKEIKLYNNGSISITNKGVSINEVDKMILNNERKYILKRKKVTFTKAFKAYEEGKEIESCATTRQYNKERETQYVINTSLMAIEEIRGEWYINE